MSDVPNIPQSPPRIGSLIQALRAERGMTLDDLSRIAGVSKSMLSEIERDKANPTIAVTWRLANAFGLELAQLFTAEREQPNHIHVVRRHETPALSGPEQRYQLRILGPMELAGRFEWYELTLAPHGELVSAGHDPGAREHLTVLEGELEVCVQDERHVLQSGETARYGADCEHAIHNRHALPARAVLVVIHP